MKKLLIIPFIIAFCFITQIFYTGYVNERIFNQLIKNQNFDYKIEDFIFQKGFLYSKANFTIKDKRNLGFSSQVDLIFNNNYFANCIAQGTISNPFKFLAKGLKNQQLAQFTIKPDQNNFNLLIQFQDINLSDEGGDTLLKNASMQIAMDQDMKATNIHLSIGKVQFSQFYTKFSMQNFNYKQNFNHPIPLSNIMQIKESIEEISFNSFVLNNNKISSFYSKNILHFNDENNLRIHFRGKANNILIDASSKLYQNVDFDQIDFDIILDKIAKYSYNKFDFSALFKDGLNLQIIDLKITKDKQNIDIDGNTFISEKNNKASIQIFSTEEPDKIFSWGQFFGGLNQYFIKNDNGFMMNFSYDNNATPQLKINGNQLLRLDLN
ncbi:hypothetical protein [Campylobacter aviculae]|uniref:DUF945 domain-containing protein n=1 Tax=Campylobacter aviculae TaxID=2510190 RepID=A0A4U7BQ37_9BACT|nr:hypothetical protein [Campylobacter aviculae]TKX30764.1 hypothetical protein CQA76_07445 [Campylobacter aviculae]